MTSTQTPAPNGYWRNAGMPAEGPTQVIPNARGRYVPPAPQPYPAGPQWGPPAPPQWTVPTGPPNNGGKKWAIIASAVAVAASVTAVAVVLTSGGSDSDINAGPTTTMTQASTPQPTPPAAESDDTAEDAPAPDALLLSPVEMEDAVGGSIVMKGEGSKPTDNSGVIDNAKCMSAWGPLERKSYAGSGYDEVAGQALEDTSDPSHVVVQGAASFPSRQKAQAYLADAERSWRACANLTVVATNKEGKETPWLFGGVETAAGGLLTMSQNPVGSTGWGCERALGGKGAIVVDTLVCGPRPAGEAVAVAEAILANVPGKSA